MRDSEGHIGSVTTELITGKDNAQMILTCDEASLASAVFPVVIDPLVETYQHSSAMEDNFVTSNSPSTVQSYSQDRLRICKNTSYGECRSFLKFTDLPYFLPCNMVTKAYLRMSLYTQQGSQAVPVYLKEVLSDWSSQTITWNNQPELSEHDVDVAIIPANAGVGSTFAFDISNLVRKWYSGSNYGVAFERKITSTPNTVEFGSSDSVYHKPVIMINYVSFAGLQSHLTYDTMDCGRAGRAHVNLYNGDLVIERPLTHCGGNRMPVSITAYYNYDMYACSAPMGTGGRLSCDQNIYKVNINNELHFVWHTGDGNRIYFKNQDSTVHYYQDLSGLSLKLYDDGDIYIEDKQGTELTFENPASIGDESGRLLRIMDACGNTNTFQYTGWNLTGITDGAGRVTTISYTDNLVSSILAPGETAPVRFEYYANRLNLITDADGSETTISWNTFMDNPYSYHVTTIGGNDGRYLSFRYPWDAPYRLESMSILYPDGEALYGDSNHQYTYKDMMTVVHDATVENGKDLYYQFNDFGNVVCVRDELGYASYSKFSDALLPNHPEQVSKLQRSVVNLLSNHNLEVVQDWFVSMRGAAEGKIIYSYDRTYTGRKSLRYSHTNGESEVSCYTNYSGFTVGKQYTLSGYINTDDGYSCRIGIYQNEAWYLSPYVIPDGWTRIQLTFTATATDAQLHFLTKGPSGTTGYLWLDSVQLEEGCVANRYNILENGDFSLNDSGVPTFWTANGVNTSADGIVTDADALHPTFLSNNRMRLYGDPQTNKGFYQDLPLSGSQGDVFVVGGWAKGFSRPIGNEPRRFAIRLAFKNSSGEFVNSDILNWNEEWTDWQYISGAVIAPCAYTAIRYNVDYEKNVNYADFDGLTLYKEEFGNTFTYDEEGNVTAVKNLASKQAKAEYDDCNNLISYVQPGRPDSAKTVLDCGSIYPEKRKRLVYSITSPTNIRTKNSYDAYGNLTRSYLIDAMDGNYVIDTHQTHTSDGNHVATKTDSRGKVVTYTTDLAKDTLTSVTDPNGQSVSYTYDSRKRVTGTSATADGKTYKNAYTYEKDRLKTVSHNTTSDTPDVTYTFDYDRFGNPTTVKVGTQTLSTNVYTTTSDHTLTRVEYGNGGKVHYTRDDFRRVTGIHYDDATAPRFTYDYGANGQATYVRDSELNRTAFTEYDTSERPIRMQLFEGATATYIGSPRYVGTVGYDEFGNVASYKEKVNNSADYETTYTYDVENRPTQLRYGADNRKVNYTYDPIGRLTKRTLTGTTSYETTYQYVAPDNTDGITTTPLVKSITQPGHSFSYTYDNVGNISREVYNGKNTTYVYDSLGQLIRYNDERAGKSWVFTYDRGGNLTKEQRYAYTEGTPGAVEYYQDFQYGNTNWKDQMTRRVHGGFYNYDMTYDAIGNLTSYAGWTYTWAQGRRLVKQVQDSKTVEYTYDASGLRVRKKYNSTISDYTWSGEKLVHLKVGSQDMHFFYDAEGMPAMMLYNQTPYRYVRNLQGDIIALVDTSGTTVVEYKYDPWGKKESVTGTLADSVGWYNPFRYRGYIFDQETLMYYLKDRYYYPELRRFINADATLGLAGQIAGHNVYSYCRNDSVNHQDDGGMSSEAAIFLPVSNLPSFSETLSVIGSVVSSTAAKALGGVGLFFSIVLTPAETANDEIAYVYATDISDLEHVARDVEISDAQVKKYRRYYHLHHIVPKKHPAALPSQIILKVLLYRGVENSANKVYLPADGHQSLHSHSYIGYVNARIIHAERSGTTRTQKMNSVLYELRSLRAFLLGASLL